MTVLAPEWLAHRYDDTNDAVQFVRADRAERGRIAFLTDELLSESGSPLAVARADAVTRLPPPVPLHFVFHSAYCCSTLMANALDIAGVASTLKEPQILNDLVGWRQRRADPQRLHRVLHDTLALIARPFETGEACVVKPSNVVNSLATALLTMRPGARAILMYAPLPAFLASIARKGMWGRLWVRDLLAKHLTDGLIEGLGFAPADLLRQTDLQVAAIGWLAQHRLFADLAARFPKRVRALDSEVFVAEPARFSRAAMAHFGLASTEDVIDAAVARTFSRNAKDGSAFGPDERSRNREEGMSLHRDEIEKVVLWTDAVAKAANVASVLSLPLK